MNKENKLRNQIITEANRVADACRIAKGTPYQILSALSTADLKWFVAGKTLDYGRSAIKSIENAECHVCSADSRKRYIRLVCKPTTVDTFGAC